MKKCAVIALLLGGLLAGCGAGDDSATANFSTVPVTGKVSAKGKPVTSGLIILAPVAGGKSQQQATGEIKEDGTFQLMSAGGKSGAMPGDYTSHLEKLDGTSDKTVKPVSVSVPDAGGEITVAFE